MTRATSKPVIRVVRAGSGPFPELELVVEVTDREVALRPIRTRRGGPQECRLTWGTILTHAALAKIESELRAKRRGRVRR